MTVVMTGEDSDLVYRAARQDKPWGHEIIFAAGEAGYVGKVIHVSAGHSLSLQYHERKVETISVLSGEGVVDYGPSADRMTRRALVPGDTIHVPALTIHRMTALVELGPA